MGVDGVGVCVIEHAAVAVRTAPMRNVLKTYRHACPFIHHAIESLERSALQMSSAYTAISSFLSLNFYAMYLPKTLGGGGGHLFCVPLGQSMNAGDVETAVSAKLSVLGAVAVRSVTPACVWSNCCAVCYCTVCMHNCCAVCYSSVCTCNSWCAVCYCSVCMYNCCTICYSSVYM